MKFRSLLFTLLATLSVNAQSADTSSRTLYILADTPVSHLELGLYKLDLALESQLRPNLARFLNILTDMVRTRTYITVGKDTSMVLVIETTVESTADRERTKRQAQNICDLVLSEQVGFMRSHKPISFFNSKDPFTDPLPSEFADNLEAVIRLKARVPTGGPLPTVECMTPLRATVDG